MKAYRFGFSYIFFNIHYISVPVCLYLPISCELFSIILAFSLITLFPWQSSYDNWFRCTYFNFFLNIQLTLDTTQDQQILYLNWVLGSPDNNKFDEIYVWFQATAVDCHHINDAATTPYYPLILLDFFS